MYFDHNHLTPPLSRFIPNLPILFQFYDLFLIFCFCFIFSFLRQVSLCNSPGSGHVPLSPKNGSSHIQVSVPTSVNLLKITPHRHTRDLSFHDFIFCQVDIINHHGIRLYAFYFVGCLSPINTWTLFLYISTFIVFTQKQLEPYGCYSCVFFPKTTAYLALG